MLRISQEKLAECVGMTFQQIQKYERGTNRISASRLWDISKILRVPVGFFYADMPSEVANQSPRNLILPDSDIHISKYWPEDTVSDPDVMEKRETLELVMALSRINNPKIEEKFLEMFKSLAGEDDLKD
jgi:predicted transcriptional regulator